MSNTIDILTVSLSIPAIVLCAMVLRHWFPESIRAIRERRDAADWLVLGVMTSFSSIVGNTSWWAIYWGMRIVDHPSQEWWLSNGSFANLFTRQGAVLVAAFCHLKAYQTFTARGGSVRPETHLLWSLGLGGLLFAVLFTLTVGNI